MRMKKGAMTVTGLIVAMLVTMAIFFGAYNYIDHNYDQANVVAQLDEDYATSYENLDDSKEELGARVDSIKVSADNIKEADGNFIQVAWNGLTGLASTMRLFIGLIGIGIDIMQAIIPPLSLLPDWVTVLLSIAIIATLALVIIGAFKGETKT